MDNMTLGERIKKERQKMRFTQEQLGEMSEVTSTYIGQIERGERTPSLKRLRKIAKQLNVTEDYLIVGEETSKVLNRELITEFEGISDKQKKLAVEIIRIIKKYG